MTLEKPDNAELLTDAQISSIFCEAGFAYLLTGHNAAHLYQLARDIENAVWDKLYEDGYFDV